jgi:tetratricopeptide (TPR) repeat protein
VKIDPLIAEAGGYVQLGMLDEAEALLNQIPETEAEAYLAAQNALLQIHISRSQNERAADTGTRLILEGAYDAQTIVSTMAALSFIGRPKEGRQVLLLVEKFGRPVAAHAYQMACFDSLSGDFPGALRWLEVELQKPRYFSQRAIGDSDLFPLWRWLGSGHLNLQDAHRLLQMELESHCVAACDPSADIQLDENDLKGLPEEFRDFFRFNFTLGIFELNPSAVAKKPILAREFHEARARHVTKVASMIRAGVRKALDVVIDAQPKYAAEKAALGNHLGLRYHVVWALARRPELIGMFYAEPDRTGLYDLLDSLSDVEQVDPGFCARMDLIGELIFVDFEEAWKLLDRTPGSVRGHPLFLLRQAMAYGSDTDHERALPIYLKLCETWPDDAVGFGNACDCLMKLGQWAEAEAVLDRAPECYQTFHLYRSQRENLRQHTLDCSPPKTVSFRGQRDLGGLLIPPRLLKSQPTAVPPFKNIEDKEALIPLLPNCL